MVEALLMSVRPSVGPSVCWSVRPPESPLGPKGSSALRRS